MGCASDYSGRSDNTQDLSQSSPSLAAFYRIEEVYKVLQQLVFNTLLQLCQTEGYVHQLSLPYPVQAVPNTSEHEMTPT